MNTRCIDGTELGELVEISLVFPETDQEPQLVIDVAGLIAALPLAPVSQRVEDSQFRVHRRSPVGAQRNGRRPGGRRGHSWVP
jgi:hypothetical protein